MPKNPNVKRVMVIGSGPIVIGQAAEFDYAGTQACRSLKEEGVEVILVNSITRLVGESGRASSGFAFSRSSSSRRRRSYSKSGMVGSSST